MENWLHYDFFRHLAFCGGCTQKTELPHCFDCNKAFLSPPHWRITVYISELITSFYRTFGCPIMCIDTYSQCYFGHWHLQQCLIRSSSLVGQDAIFVDGIFGFYKYGMFLTGLTTPSLITNRLGTSYTARLKQPDKHAGASIQRSGMNVLQAHYFEIGWKDISSKT